VNAEVYAMRINIVIGGDMMSKTMEISGLKTKREIVDIETTMQFY